MKKQLFRSDLAEWFLGPWRQNTCWDKNEKFSNQEMLLTEYHPGHPSTENKFKIQYMVII